MAALRQILGNESEEPFQLVQRWVTWGQMPSGTAGGRPAACCGDASCPFGSFACRGYEQVGGDFRGHVGERGPAISSTQWTFAASAASCSSCR